MVDPFHDGVAATVVFDGVPVGISNGLLEGLRIDGKLSSDELQSYQSMLLSVLVAHNPVSPISGTGANHCT